MLHRSHRERRITRELIGRTPRRRGLAASGVLAALALVPFQVSATPALQPGQVWSGSYRCGGQAGTLSLRFTAVPTDVATSGKSSVPVEAVLSFEEAGRAGSHRLAGRYAHGFRVVNMEPEEWVEQPRGAVAMGFMGTLAKDGSALQGRLMRPDCTTDVSLGQGTVAEVAARQATQSRASSPASAQAGSGTGGVEVFGIRLGGPLDWPTCIGRSPRPCVFLTSRDSTRDWHLDFGSDRKPAMIVGGPLLDVVDQRVERVSIEIRREDEHLQAFEQKFGPPKKELVPMHNDGGGRWTGFIHRWDVAGTSIEVDCTRFERVCGVEIETAVWRQQQEQDKARRQSL